MMDATILAKAFPQLKDISIIRGNVGGQKEVCQAELNGEHVALKLIHLYSGSNERTERELAAVKKLNSSYVPKLYDAGKVTIGAETRDFIIEQFIDGETYRLSLSRQPVQPFQAVLDLAQVLLLAVCDFENAGLIHRDLKPENLMIEHGSRKIWIIDFGLARDLSLPSITPAGLYQGVGTIGYAAPEQFRNLRSEINIRADLFAIGVIIHESLQGYHYYWRNAPDQIAVMHKMEKEDLSKLAIPCDPSNLFSDFIACLSQRFPSRRPQSAKQAYQWFEPIYSQLKKTSP
jgi:serine/threonine protein kinase